MIRFFNNANEKKIALPEILASDLKDQSVYESTPVTFEIVAQGIPKLEAQWTLNDKPLKPDDHFNITNDGLKYTLSIADVKLSDAGQFQVVVKNKLGEQSKQCELKVMRMYKIFSHFIEFDNEIELDFVWIGLQPLPTIGSQFY